MTRFWGCGRRSKVRPCQLIRLTTAVWFGALQGWKKGNEGVGLVWLWGGGVALPTQEMRWALARVVWQNSREGVVCILAAVWFLWDCLQASCGLPVVSWHLVGDVHPWGTGWCCCGYGLAPLFRPSIWFIEDIKWTLLALTATPCDIGN